jgi:hypothetical protein
VYAYVGKSTVKFSRLVGPPVRLASGDVEIETLNSVYIARFTSDMARDALIAGYSDG